jgi:hypothetical protein
MRNSKFNLAVFAVLLLMPVSGFLFAQSPEAASGLSGPESYSRQMGGPEIC